MIWSVKLFYSAYRNRLRALARIQRPLITVTNRWSLHKESHKQTNTTLSANADFMYETGRWAKRTNYKARKGH
jgi:hypothetical protein